MVLVLLTAGFAAVIYIKMKGYIAFYPIYLISNCCTGRAPSYASTLRWFATAGRLHTDGLCQLKSCISSGQKTASRVSRGKLPNTYACPPTNNGTLLKIRSRRLPDTRFRTIQRSYAHT